MNTVSPDFFSLLGIPIVRGRVFADGEVDAVLVSESTARRYWPGQDAVGRAITTGGRRRQIVGIVRDARVSQAQDAISSYMYLPAARGAQRNISVLARTHVDFEGFAAAVRAETVPHGCQSARERPAAVEQSCVAADAVADRGGRRRHVEPARTQCSRQSASTASSHTSSAAGAVKSACGWRSAPRPTTSSG